MELKELAEQLNVASTEIKNAQTKLADELKTVGAESAETKAALAKAQANFNELKGLFEKVDAKLIEIEQKQKRPGFEHAAGASLGELVTKGGNVQIGARFEIEKKDISGVAASAGALVRPNRDPSVYQNPNRPLRIRDLIPTLPASSNAVEVMRENVFTNNAAPQGTTAGIGAGELVAKAESNITYELVTYPIRTIAHYINASRQVLSDSAVLQSLINNRLTYGLDLESDEQLLLGSGTGQNLTGLLVDAGVSDVGQLPANTTGDAIPRAMIDKIREAITTCQTFEYYNVNGIVLNPADFARLEQAKGTDGHYMLVPFAATNTQTPQIWRVPVIVTNAMPANQFILGDWSMGAQIHDRESVSIAVSESHGTNFTTNAVTIRGEERYCLAIPLPKAFCKGAFTVAA